MTWTRLKEYPLYEMHSDSRVRNIHSGRILTPQIVKGYLVIGLWTGQRQRLVRLHRLLWRTFRGEIPEGLVVNHIDGCKTNNALENLEIVTVKENTHHAIRLGLHPRGPKPRPSLTYDYRRGAQHYDAKLTDELVRELRIADQKFALNYAATGKKLGVSGTTIMYAIRGQSWKHVR